MPDRDVFTLAQLTDVHLGPMPPFWPRHWNVKRGLGYFNFWTKRRLFNDPRLVRMLVEDLQRQRFDHVAVTGDLANIGMPSEHIRALKWLEGVGAGHEVTVIPGNHDIYARLWRDPGVERWRGYMQARGLQDHVAGLPEPLDGGFPFVRTFGRFALIGINSAVPTPPAVASGTVGREQCERFAAISRCLHDQGYCRIVLIHHPPLPEHGRRALTDAPAFEGALLDAGAELVLHGHNHRPMISWRDTSTGPLPIIGAGSAGEGVYNIYHLARGPGNSLQIEIVERAGSIEQGSFAERKRTMISSDDRQREIAL